jgi:hypothetical protein
LPGANTFAGGGESTDVGDESEKLIDISTWPLVSVIGSFSYPGSKLLRLFGGDFGVRFRR